MIDIRTPGDHERKKLLGFQEDHFNDLKSSKITPAHLQKHLVAFANADGGELYVGVEDKKVKGPRIRGFKNIEDANDHIKVLLEETQPGIENVELEMINFGSRGYVLHVIIPKSPHVHYTSDGQCYLRLNASSNKILGRRITELAYAKGHYSYETVAVSGLEVEDIVSNAYIKEYMQRIQSSLPPDKFLKKQGLLVNSDVGKVPSVGCVLLFDDEPQATLDTRCAIKIYRLKTTNKDYKRGYLSGAPITIEGPIEYQIYQVLRCVEELLKDASYNVNGKIIKLQYPSEALKEILVNAVIHRDYSLNDDIHVKIYDNRIEIISPGTLPGYITKDNILDERYSRNPKIVRLLHKLPDPVNMDIGEGLNTAFNALNKAGLVEPTIEELENSVVVTIKHQKLASLEDEILNYLKDNDSVANRDIRKLTGEESENKVKKAFQKLREKGEIEPVNPNATPFQYKWKKCKR